ncbi:hypothetical protein [Mucilaginibacter sp. AK015]|uniref:hypothetical protein n=1 Tax=Mucilaginibacter sp. AK015 TaxID=2723072 RepID=UPI0016123BE7|nr:hypothetical protein [Mucilaginibacter sp. AK015]MBB5395073.1 hypothetical protein [Mucilaginibacter sp. AK015]
MNYSVVVKVSRRSVAFWYQAGGKRYSPLLMKGVSEVPLYFYVRDNQFEFGISARDRFYRHDPDAFGDYFELIGDPVRHFMLHDSPKRVKQLLYYGIEQYLSHFLLTVMYKNDAIEAYRGAFPLKFIFGPDLEEPERALVAEMFREAGYRTVSVLSYSNLLIEHLRSAGIVGGQKAVLVLTGLDGTLYAELYKNGAEGPLTSIALPNQGADPRIRILAGMILTYITDQCPYLDLDTGRELNTLIPYCANLLQDPPVILTGEAELSTGDKYWFRINMTKVEESLQYYSGDLAANTAITDLLRRVGVLPEDVVVLLATGAIQTPYFSRRLLKQYPRVLPIEPVHTDGAMQLVFRKAGPRPITPPPEINSVPAIPGPVTPERPKMPPARPPVPAALQRGKHEAADKRPPLPAATPKTSPVVPPPLPPVKKKTNP